MHHRLYDFQLLQQDNQFHHRHRREWLYVAFVELEESSGRKRGWMRISGWANHMSNCSSLWLRERSELNSCNFIGLEVLEDALITTQSQLCQIFCQTRYRTSYLFWSDFAIFLSNQQSELSEEIDSTGDEMILLYWITTAVNLAYVITREIGRCVCSGTSETLLYYCSNLHQHFRRKL